MKDQKKTKSQLIDELETLRLKVAPLEGSRTGVAWASDLGERQYQQIFEALTDALLVTDREGRIVEGNPAACRMYGYKYDELVGMNATGLVHPDGRCIFEESLESSTPGEVFRTEAIDVRKDGSAFPVEVVAVDTTFKGSPHFLAVVRDTSERSHTERVLHSLVEGTSGVTGDAFSQSVVEHLASALEVDYAFVGKFADDTGSRVQTLAFWTGSGISETFDYATESTPCEEVVSGKVALYQDHVSELFPDDQELIELGVESYLGVPIFGSTGTVIGHVAVLDTKPMQNFEWMRSVLQIFASRAGAEIERVQTEEKLQEAVDRYALATDAAKVGIWDWNIQTNEFYLDPNIKAALGYSDYEPNDLKGWLQCVHSEDRKSVMDEAQACIDGRVAEYVIEHRMLHKDGSVRWALVRGRTIRNSESTAVRMVGTNTDITDRKKLEAQLFQAQKMEGVGRLAGGIAHDFNTLLTIILGLTREIQLDPSNPLADEIEDIQHAAERAALLTRQLLAFSRRQVLQPKVLRPDELVTGFLSLVEKLLGEDIKLLTDLDRGTGYVKADPVQIEQIVMNLAANARDAMPEGGEVTIETADIELDDSFVQTHPGSVEGLYVRLRFRDTGVGMDSDTRKRVFEPFFTTKKPDAGTGLGLAMVYGIVKKSGGYITLSSDLGKGTVFDIYLPRVPEVTASPSSLSDFRRKSFVFNDSPFQLETVNTVI